MKRLLTKICVPLITILIVTSLGAFPVTCTANSDAQDQALAFIENVLPVDLSTYNITLISHLTDYGPPIVGVTGQSINREIDSLLYTLNSDESTLRVIFQIQNNAVLSCHIYVDEGSVISDRQYGSLVDVTKSVLERYQTYSKIDSAIVIDMLADVDVTKNSSTITGNINFTTNTINAYGIEVTNFRWAYTVNGAEYTQLGVEFQDGVFSCLYDTRGVYSIGDTTVNISSDQAIDIATKYTATYSYALSDGSRVSDFNINEDKSAAKLVASPINSTELRPYWHVELYLDQTYPGHVEGLAIYLWANSGEVFACSNIAYGGELPDTSPSPSSSPENNTASVEISTIAIVAAVATVVVIATSAVFIKKRSK